MRNLSIDRSLFGLAVLFALPQVAAAQAVDSPAVNALCEDAVKSWEAPGVAVGIVRNGRLAYLKAFGVRDMENGQRLTPDTVFPLASCSKAFTSTAMAMLVDERKMDWNDRVRKHVPYFRLADPLADANVTLRDLVSHRTGVAPHELLWYRAPWKTEEMIRRIGRVQPSRSFRSAFQYQSIMFMAAGEAVGSASGVSWAEFVQKRIFNPLQMTSASLTTTVALKAPDHASAHRRGRDGKVEVIPWYEIDTPNAAGSVNASARDLARWLEFQLGDGTFRGKPLVSAKNLEETRSPQTIIRLEGRDGAMNPDTLQMSYGMGWVFQDYHGHLLVSHAGAIDGFRAHITLAPKDRLGVVILCNLHQTRLNLALSNSIVDLLLNLPHRDWNDYVAKIVQEEEAARRARAERFRAKRREGTRPSLKLEEYVGVFEEPAYGTARVRLENGALVWEWSTFRCPLEHFHFDTFLARNEILGDPPLVFTLDGGKVRSLRTLDVTFNRKK